MRQMDWLCLGCQSSGIQLWLLVADGVRWEFFSARTASMVQQLRLG